MSKFLKIIDPYMRLGRFDKPIGGWLSFWPAAYAITLTSNYGFFDPIVMGSALAGTFMLRAAGCAANDNLDRELDKQVERTKTRPIAAGEISPAQGWAYCLVNMAPIPALLYWCDPAVISVMYMTVPVITLYPLAKRYLKHPQFVLGFSMNYAFVMAYAFTAGHLDLQMLPFMGGMWCWTVLYDTIYAYQDLKGDKLAGNNSTAVAWEGKEMDIFERLTIGMGACFVYGGYLAQLGPLYYPAIAYTIFKFSKTWVGLDLNDTKACSISFRKNHQIGAYIFLAILLGKLSQKRKDEKVEKVEKVD